MGRMQITVAWLGKSKHAAIRELTEEYLARLRGFSRFAAVEGLELAGRDPEAALVAKAGRSAELWLLDPAGRSFDSPGFARWLERRSRGLILAIGGADGFGPRAQAAAAGTLSLSALTLSHELARVVALEQVYRALAILTHHPYPH